jgi:hypothetical protein
MKINSVIKRDSIKETTFKLLDKKTKIKYLIFIILIILFIILSIIFSNTLATILSIILLITQILSFFFLVKAKEDVQLKVFDKTYPKGEYTLIINFKKEEIVFGNDHFSKLIKVNYEDIDKIEETKNYYILLLKKKSHFLIKKEDINIEELKGRIGEVTECKK